jgi:adenylate cyclase class 2
MRETETKILNVDSQGLKKKFDELGALKTADTKLAVDWFRPIGTKEGEDKWFLRIRTYSDGKNEVTWKGKSDVLGASRTHKEINFDINDPSKLSDLFEQIGLEKYAHQEKFRMSWQYKDWKFDLDAYPKMPPYLEIEGTSESHIQEAIQLLGLENHKASSEGERTLIQNTYGLNWYDMRF